MSPSGCHISLEITFQPLCSSQPLITEVLAFDFYFPCATLYAGYWFYDQAAKWYLRRCKCRGITTVPPGPLDTQGSAGAFIWEILMSLQTQPYHSLLHQVLLDQPQQLPLNSDHIQSTPHKWPFHLTCIYSLPISQAGKGILEDKISPFSNLKTVTTVLESYGLTRNMGAVTFSCCGSCICTNWITLPCHSQLLCSWFYLLIRDDSLFISN